MSTSPAPLYPLKLAPIYKEKVWGGRALAARGRDLPGDGDTPVGESWELADLAVTSTGGGGGSERSAVANGPLAGRTLHELVATHGSALLGDLPLTAAGGFPVLLKYLDANANLSVQVHPSPAWAAAHADAHLKSEAWYIVDAAPGAVIYKGLIDGVTPDALRAALRQNTDAAVVPLLRAVPVQPGDCHYLVSGTCHALGAGVLVAEVQTPSDTTYRVYDWGRTGRELHVEPALACIDFDPPTGEGELNAKVDDRLTRLVECEHFRIDRVTAEANTVDAHTHNQPAAWMILEGRLTLDGGGQSVNAGPCDTVLLPPNVSTHVTAHDHATWLEVTFPQAEQTKLA